MEITTIFYLWQYPASVLFIGTLLGNLLYRIVPPPSNTIEHFRRMTRAGMISTVAGLTGYGFEEKLADFVGASEAIVIMISLRRQRRWLLILGLIIGSIIMLLAFMYFSVLSIPDWLFGTCAMIGLYWIWKVW